MAVGRSADVVANGEVENSGAVVAADEDAVGLVEVSYEKNRGAKTQF